MQPQEQFRHLVPAFLELVEPLAVEDLSLPTPCTDWDVRDLLEHMTSGALTFAGALRGDAPSGPSPDVRDAIGAALNEFAAALDFPGAFDRAIGGLPFGEMDGRSLGRYAAFDLLMHSWDLATATRRPLRESEPVVAAVDAWARAWLVDDFRQPGMFAEETEAPSEATTLQRLVAFSGRNLDWSPPSRDSG